MYTYIQYIQAKKSSNTSTINIISTTCNTTQQKQVKTQFSNWFLHFSLSAMANNIISMRTPTKVSHLSDSYQFTIRTLIYPYSFFRIFTTHGSASINPVYTYCNYMILSSSCD
ncbi:hypothetical protein V6Z12_A03G134300 [Gossypium hirsutum]